MINIILITSRFKDTNIQLAEERILSHFEKINQTHFTLIKHYTPYNNTSVLFKKYPIAYVDNHLLPANKIVLFLYRILFKPSDEDVEHFDYLMMFLEKEYRFTYYKQFVNDSNAITGAKREIDVVKMMKSFVEFYKDKKEKDFIYFVISAFIAENKSNEINECDIGIIVNDYLFKNELINVFLYDYNKEAFDSTLKQYEINLNESEHNNNINNNNVNIEEQQIERNWKNNLFSIGLFTFITSAMYLLSVLSHRKK